MEWAIGFFVVWFLLRRIAKWIDQDLERRRQETEQFGAQIFDRAVLEAVLRETEQRERQQR